MGKYDDIIGLPHKQSSKRPHMSNAHRAAQFSPFAALTGYEAEVKEKARLTDEKRELGEYEREALDYRLQRILQEHETQPEVTIIYFLPDKKKAGGAYETVTGVIKKYDSFQRTITFQDGTKIRLDMISEIKTDAAL